MIPRFVTASLFFGLLLMAGCGPSQPPDEQPVNNKKIKVEKGDKEKLAGLVKKHGGNLINLESPDGQNHYGINFSSNSASDKTLKELIPHLGNLDRFRRLSFNRNPITDDALQEITQFKQLRELDLSNTKITNAGLKELAKLPHLEVLYLYDTQITTAGFAELAKLKQLKELYLSGPKITFASIEVLKQDLPKCKIVKGS